MSLECKVLVVRMLSGKFGQEIFDHQGPIVFVHGDVSKRGSKYLYVQEVKMCVAGRL